MSILSRRPGDIVRRGPDESAQGTESAGPRPTPPVVNGRPAGAGTPAGGGAPSRRFWRR
jgi:hypothetical protein